MSFEQPTLCYILWALHTVSSFSKGENISVSKSQILDNFTKVCCGFKRWQVKRKEFFLTKPLPQSSGQFENYDNFSVPHTNWRQDFWTRHVRANLKNYSGYLALYSVSIQSCKKWTSVLSLCSEHWCHMDVVSRICSHNRTDLIDINIQKICKKTYRRCIFLPKVIHSFEFHWRVLLDHATFWSYKIFYILLASVFTLPHRNGKKGDDWFCFS